MVLRILGRRVIDAFQFDKPPITRIRNTVLRMPRRNMFSFVVNMVVILSNFYQHGHPWPTPAGLLGQHLLAQVAPLSAVRPPVSRSVVLERVGFLALRVRGEILELPTPLPILLPPVELFHVHVYELLEKVEQGERVHAP